MLSMWRAMSGRSTSPVGPRRRFHRRLRDAAERPSCHSKHIASRRTLLIVCSSPPYCSVQWPSLSIFLTSPRRVRLPEATPTVWPSMASYLRNHFGCNTDLTKDDGQDLPHFKKILTDLDMASAAQCRWKAASLHFKTHKGDEVHRPFHIDYILVSKRSVSAVKAFGVAAPADLMIDYDHSIISVTWM